MTLTPNAVASRLSTLRATFGPSVLQIAREMRVTRARVLAAIWDGTPAGPAWTPAALDDWETGIKSAWLQPATTRRPTTPPAPEPQQFHLDLDL